MRATQIVVLLGLAGVLSALSGCSTYSLQELRQTMPKGTPFQAALAVRYMQFAEDEARNYDWADSGYFAEKGLRAAYGNDVAPEEPAVWNIPEDKLAEMTQAHDELAEMLTAGKGDEKPEAAADAVYYFDCWVENQDEDSKQSEIDYCRNGYAEAMKALATPEEAPAAAGEPEKQAYIVFFALNKAELDDQGAHMVAGMADDIKKQEGGEEYIISVNGHTDTTGSARYNMELSKRRADAVAAALAASGIDAARIHTFGFGETDLNVATKDGVSEAKNRRVQIFLGDK